MAEKNQKKKEVQGSLNLGVEFPNFKAESSCGEICWHTYIEGSWAILFSHPADYTPVCTTELARVAALECEFQKRGVKMAALSCDDAQSHLGWIKDINEYNDKVKKCEAAFKYPIIADEKRDLAEKFGMVDPDEKDSKGMPLTCRAVFIIGPDKKLKLSILYPATTGRNFDEILRVVDSLQLTAKHDGKLATPADWKPGKAVMATPKAGKTIPGYEIQQAVKLPSGKQYLRLANPCSAQQTQQDEAPCCAQQDKTSCCAQQTQQVSK